MSILLDGTSRVLVQGISARQARTHLPYMLRYGTRVLAGVAPGHGGEALEGVPVYDTVAGACRDHEIDVSVLFVPAPAARDAALEAIEHGIPLVQVLAEGVPHHDTVHILERAEVKGVRVIGPNSQGMISPGKAKLGGTGGAEPERLFRPGPVGIISRSGGMGGEIGNALTRRGIGQSTYVSIGGDLLIGTGFAPLLELFEADPETRAVVIFGEPGTGHEEAAAELVRAGGFTKPLVALIVGDALERLPRGMSFGHTSSIIERGLGSPTRKKTLLRGAGALVANSFAEVPDLVARALDRAKLDRERRRSGIVLPPEIDARIDEYVTRTRELTGQEVREREPWNTEVTADAIRHFAYGTDDDNPLWLDPEYAARTRHGAILAPPAFLVSVLYPILHGAQMPAPLASLIGGIEYEWFERIRLGDRLRATSVQKDFYEKKSGQGRRLHFVISEVTYWNQNEQVVGKATGTMIMASQVGEQLQMERQVRRYGEDKLAALDRAFKAETRAGACGPAFEDVAVGDELPSIVRGPLTIGDMVCWNAAIGPSYKAGRWGYLELQKSAHTAVRNPVTGFAVKYSQQHEDFNLAAQRGMPGPFDNGVMRFAWVAPLVTNWMGDDGFLKKLYAQVRQPGIYGDIQTYRGRIAGKDEDQGMVRIEITGTNQEGEVSTRGEAEVLLSRR